MSQELCPCKSNKKFMECCGKFLEKKETPKTAEELMRSRYSAYTMGHIDYLFDTHHESTKEELNRDEMTAWSKEASWHGLEIVKTDAGGEKDNQGLVEFICQYQIGEKMERHHEVSSFVKENGKWFFHEGRFVHETIRRESPKIGRNDPCSCGSGKKYKKCCGV